MKLSIIIPMFKVEAFIEKCLISCESQDLPHDKYEIICINDGSPDQSGEIAKCIAKEFDNIIVLDQENRGLSAARNCGMNRAIGDYYMFVDSDDWIAENCLGKIIKKLQNEKPDALAICAANVINDVFERRQSYPDETPITGKDLLKKGVQPNAWLSIWSASFLKKYNFTFYEGIFHEDAEFTPRAYYYAKKVSLCNDICYYVRQNPNSIMRSVNPKKSFDLINVVCPHLSDFAKSVDSNFKVVFCDLVGMHFNNALSFIRQSNKEDQDNLNKVIIEHKELWNDLLHSSIFKYRIEAILFGLFPKHPVSVYKILQMIHGK